MTCRQLRKSKINWTILGIGAGSIVILVIALIFTAIYAVVYGLFYSKNTWCYGHSIDILGEIELMENESISNCSYVIEEIDGDEISAIYNYTITNVNRYEIKFGNYGFGFNETIKINNNEIDSNVTNYLEPGTNNIELYIECCYQGHDNHRMGQYNIEKIEDLYGKSVSFAYSLSDSVENVKIVESDGIVIGDYTYDLVIETTEKQVPTFDYEKFNIGCAIVTVSINAAIAIFEITIAILSHIEKKKEQVK